MPRPNMPTEEARAMANARITRGAGSGRPRSTDPRCACGKYTAKTARERYHVCVTGNRPRPVIGAVR